MRSTRINQDAGRQKSSPYQNDRPLFGSVRQREVRFGNVAGETNLQANDGPKGILDFRPIDTCYTVGLLFDRDGFSIFALYGEAIPGLSLALEAVEIDYADR